MCWHLFSMRSAAATAACCFLNIKQDRKSLLYYGNCVTHTTCLLTALCAMLYRIDHRRRDNRTNDRACCKLIVKHEINSGCVCTKSKPKERQTWRQRRHYYRCSYVNTSCSCVDRPNLYPSATEPPDEDLCCMIIYSHWILQHCRSPQSFCWSLTATVWS